MSCFLFRIELPIPSKVILFFSFPAIPYSYIKRTNSGSVHVLHIVNDLKQLLLHQCIMLINTYSMVQIT